MRADKKVSENNTPMPQINASISLKIFRAFQTLRSVKKHRLLIFMKTIPSFEKGWNYNIALRFSVNISVVICIKSKEMLKWLLTLDFFSHHFNQPYGAFDRKPYKAL